eukprot:TRINITY_DN3996_c1_g1_i2.p1 TRINITY_DN3996_c1_g1~~TRINITY_DN3996_c1_g1_i2.p1  ORF type:complete len:591 (-),score=173.24 TRINITY_DN3996_c1_g1_i2:200-1972(-)
MSSPAFIKSGVNGSTLYIPTALCSWHGDALDTKTPLLRSEHAIDDAATSLIELIEGKSTVKSVYSAVGPEQEFFLIDRIHYLSRPDLVHSKRTLVGAKPIKAQEYRSHYFGETPARVLAFMQEAEIELSKVGIPMLARHNEVAPGQFEMAPIFEPSALAADHNMLMMNILVEVGHRHGFEVLFHEKPFAHVNGSGKHINYSISAIDQACSQSPSTDKNIFDPGHTPQANMRFMVFLAAMIRGVHVYADLLRATTAVPGNEYRLGGHEAPPAIISIYLGNALDQVCRSLMTGEEISQESGNKMITLGTTSLPTLPRDTSDRNRTSPFAFTGNRFEFRAVGASQSVAIPVTILNTIMADSCKYMKSVIETNMNVHKMSRNEAIQKAVQKLLNDHYQIVYNGDTYAPEYLEEAKRRGLPNLKAAPSALDPFDQEKNVNLFESTGVLSRRELQARSVIFRENYLGTIVTEASTLSHIVKAFIVPSVVKHNKQHASSLENMVDVLGEGLELTQQKEHMKFINSNLEELMKLTGDLDKLLVEEQNADEMPINEKFSHFQPKIIASMGRIRKICDLLEQNCDSDLWPLPYYSDMLCY